MGQQINCHSHTQQKPLFSHTDSSEPQLWSNLPAPLVLRKQGQAKVAPKVWGLKYGQWAEAGTVLSSPSTLKDSALLWVALRCPFPSRIWGILSGLGTASPAGFVEGALQEVRVRWSRAQAREGVVAMMVP